MEGLFVRVFLGSHKFCLTGGDVLNEQQQLRNAIGFNKNAKVYDLGGEGSFIVGGVKIKDFCFPPKKP